MPANTILQGHNVDLCSAGEVGASLQALKKMTDDETLTTVIPGPASVNTDGPRTTCYKNKNNELIDQS